MKSVNPGPRPVTERIQSITLTYGDIPNKDLGEALAKMDEFTDWKDPSDIHRFNKVKSIFDSEHKKATNWYMKLVDKHAVMETVKRKDPDTGEMKEQLDAKTGKPKRQPKWAPGPGGKADIVMKNAAAFENDIAIFHNHEFTIKVWRFLSEDFVKAGLTPIQIRACQKLLTDIPTDLVCDEPDDPDYDAMPPELRAILMPDTDDDVDSEPPTPLRTGTNGGSDQLSP